VLFPLFKKYISKHNLIHKGDKVIVAVSGGIDSMVLLDLLCGPCSSWSLDLTIAHVNHKLRGSESNADEEMVRAAAESYGVPCEVVRKRPPREKNTQSAAREIRLRFFKEVAGKYGAGAVATAHHLDDQAETVMFHILRGSGLRGLAGMRSVSETGSVRLIRPLLPFSRSEIEKYAKHRKIAFREDSTNAGTKYSRNFIRHRILPLLEDSTRWPAFISHPWRSVWLMTRMRWIWSRRNLSNVPLYAQPGMSLTFPGIPLLHFRRPCGDVF